MIKNSILKLIMSNKLKILHKTKMSLLINTSKVNPHASLHQIKAMASRELNVTIEKTR